MQRRNMFVRVNNISPDDKPVQLFSSCDPMLKAKVTTVERDLFSKPVDNMFKESCYYSSSH